MQHPEDHYTRLSALQLIEALFAAEMIWFNAEVQCARICKGVWVVRLHVGVYGPDLVMKGLSATVCATQILGCTRCLQAPVFGEHF